MLMGKDRVISSNCDNDRLFPTNLYKSKTGWCLTHSTDDKRYQNCRDIQILKDL